MAVQKHGIEYRVGADTGEAVSNLQKFEREFRAMLEQIGKSPKEIAAFEILAKEIERGTKSTDELDTETRKLYDTYRILKQQAKDRDFLGLQSHMDVRKSDRGGQTGLRTPEGQRKTHQQGAGSGRPGHAAAHP